MGYLPRIVDRELRNLLRSSMAISVEGIRGVGKTATASQVAKSAVRLDDPDERDLLVADRRGLLAALEPPVLVDEWHLDPPIWDTVRRLVDDEQVPGRFIVTGSANPRHNLIHPGSGRFLRLRMRPLSFAERGLAEPTVSLGSLWDGATGLDGRTDVGLADYATEVIRSGLPGIRVQEQIDPQRALEDYLAYMVEHDVPEFSGMQRRPASLRAWLKAYAAASSSTASFQTIARAVDRADSPSRETVASYREALARLWLLDEVPAWHPGEERLSGFGYAAKHQLVDPALAAALLTTDAAGLLRVQGEGDRDPALRQLRGGPLFGALFESLVTLSVRVYVEARRLGVAHLRTHRGRREVDLIVHSGDGRALAIEVKLTKTARDDDVKHLNWLKEQLGEDLIDRIVITTGTRAYRRPDGVGVVPLALLGP